MSAYYNEIDPYAAAWLKNLIAAGHIADGIVDDRSIVDVEAKDLEGFTQCHFFAGLGGWSHALRLAGWPDSRPVWTGSPPCQPFSTAGKQLGKNDDRHLAPHWLELVSQCRPANIFGEQVAAAIGHGWSDDLQDHLEAEGYAFGQIVLPACSVGSPHIRQRLWLVAERVADTMPAGRPERRPESGNGQTARGRSIGWLAYHKSERCGEARPGIDGPEARATGRGDVVRVGDTIDSGLEGHAWHGDDWNEPGRQHQEPNGPVAETGGHGGLADTKISGIRPGPTNGFWRGADWLLCRDGKWRPVESINVEMADGIPYRLGYVRTGENAWSLNPLIEKGFSRVGRLKAYGNAIVPPLAAEVIKSFMEIQE